MIPQKESRGETISTLKGRRIAMQLDPEATEHLQEVLSNLYEDPEAAVLREISTNAIDSHIEAGTTRPIEVTLPSSLMGMLVIKDYGIGANEADIEKIWSLYGASTKRESNAVTGSLGLGSKSPLTYAEQFSIVGIKDGFRTLVQVSKDEDTGVGVMTVMEETETDEPNGVEVRIPTKRYHNFAYKAADLFRFWPEGTVLVNGKEPERPEIIALNDSLKLIEGEDNYVVMGNVPYPIPSDYLNGFNSSYGLVAYVPMGAVQFTPSREALKLTKLTKDKLTKIEEEASALLENAVKIDVANSKSAPEALLKAVRWRRAVGRGKWLTDDLIYNGEPVPHRIWLGSSEEDEDGDVYERGLKWATVVRKQSRKPGLHNKYTNIEDGWLTNSLFITGYTSEKFTPSHKRKLLRYCEMNETPIDPEHFILYGVEPPLNGWVPQDRFLSWEDIKAIKIERETSGAYGVKTKKVSGSYPVWLLDGDNKAKYKFEVLASDLDTSKPIYYYTTQTFSSWRKEDNDWRVGPAAARYLPEGTVVKLALNRIEKFKRDFPEAKELVPSLQAIHEAKVLALDDEIKQAWAQQARGADLLKQLDPDYINDPMLRKAIESARLKVDGKVGPIGEMQRCDIGSWLRLPEVDLSEIEIYELAEHYPLAAARTSLYGEPHEHVYIYMNHIYALRSNEHGV